MTLSPLTLAASRMDWLFFFLPGEKYLATAAQGRLHLPYLAHGLQDAVSRSREGMKVRTSSNCSYCVRSQDQAER